jgi:predicted nucleotidyltransferase
MDMKDEWLRDLTAWASKNDSVCELWLFGSRADGTSRPESDVDIGLGLAPPVGDQDWALGNFYALSAEWRREVEAIVGRHVSLQTITEKSGFCCGGATARPERALCMSPHKDGETIATPRIPETLPRTVGGNVGSAPLTRTPDL